MMLYMETPEVNPRKMTDLPFSMKKYQQYIDQLSMPSTNKKAHFNATKGKTGRKEEHFWGKLERKANRKMELFKVFGKNLNL